MAAPHDRRETIESSLVVIAEIAPITAEELVATDAGQDHRHVAPRELRHEIGRDERGVGDRLVHVPQQQRQQRDDVRAHEDLVMIGAEQRRDLPRVRQLVVERFGCAAVEADRVGLDRSLAVPST